MSNILNFPRRRTQKSQAQSTTTAENIDGDTRMGFIPGVSEPFKVKFAPPQSKLESLEQALDEHRAKQLELAHKREAFELQMVMEQQTAQFRLEALAYRALVAGVPENDIYDLGEDMAQALHSAMETVAGA